MLKPKMHLIEPTAEAKSFLYQTTKEAPIFVDEKILPDENNSKAETSIRLDLKKIFGTDLAHVSLADARMALQI